MIKLKYRDQNGKKKSQNIGTKSTFMPKLYTHIHYNNSIQLMRNKKLKKNLEEYYKISLSLSH